MLRCDQDGLLTKLSQHGTEKATPEPWGQGRSRPLHSPQGIFLQWHFAMCRPFVLPSSSSLLRSSVVLPGHLPTAVFAKAKANGGNGSQDVGGWIWTSMEIGKEGGSWEKCCDQKPEKPKEGHNHCKAKGEIWGSIPRWDLSITEWGPGTWPREESKTRRQEVRAETCEHKTQQHTLGKASPSVPVPN